MQCFPDKERDKSLRFSNSRKKITVYRTQYQILCYPLTTDLCKSILCLLNQVYFWLLWIELVSIYIN